MFLSVDVEVFCLRLSFGNVWEVEELQRYKYFFYCVLVRVIASVQFDFGYVSFQGEIIFYYVFYLVGGKNKSKIQEYFFGGKIVR